MATAKRNMARKARLNISNITKETIIASTTTGMMLPPDAVEILKVASIHHRA
jgi:hypothetical protein